MPYLVNEYIKLLCIHDKLDTTIIIYIYNLFDMSRFEYILILYSLIKDL